jgi:hypothetical protein
MTNVNTKTTKTTLKDINEEIKAKAIELGYKFVRKTTCPDCANQIAKIEEDNDCILPWANPVCAMLFSKKGEANIVRCACGYKHRVEPYKKKEVRYCPVCAEMGIKSKLPDGMDVCYNPKHQGTKGIIPNTQETVTQAATTKTAVRKCRCGNPLPADRKKSCYTCVPKSKNKAKKEPAQKTGLQM